MDQLDLLFLGMPQVRRAGEALTFPTRKVLALLIYLVVEGDLHSREKLTALLWPESDEGRARASFRRALALLRRALGETADRTYLIVEGDRLGFDATSAYSCDLHALQLASQALSVSTLSPHLLIQQLGSAASLYRGEFLDAFSLPDAPDFDDWVRGQRALWHHRIEGLFDHLSHLQEEQGALNDALETAVRWSQCSPLNEHAYTRLMRLHFAHGSRSAALQVYADYRAMLATELQTVPAPETEALARRIRSQAPPQTGWLLTSFRPQDLPLLLTKSPLVGREREYATLIKHFRAASQHQAQVVLLIGEAGIGKTRLAREFLTWAAAQGADILHGRAFETGGRLPYQPLVEALRRRLERVNAPDDLLSDVWLTELSRLLPELRDRYSDLPLPLIGLQEAEARTHLFESVARLFHALVEQAPILLFLDDLQWADAASLDLLHYLARDWAERGSAVLVLLSLREDALAGEPGLGDWISGLGRTLPVTRLPLRPLSAQSYLRLFQVLGQREQEQAEQHPSAALERVSQWLFAETGGHPFFLMETLKALLSQGVFTVRLRENGTGVIVFEDAVRQENEVRTLLPAGVRELIRSRMARLSVEASELLAAAAVLGQGFTFEQLSQVAQLSEREGLHALEEVCRGGLLLEASTPERLQVDQPYAFAHDKIREVVYTEAGEARRRILHRRALSVLQGGAAPVTQLAHHAVAANLFSPAFHWSASAGDEAVQLFATTQARQHYKEALEALARLPDTEEVRHHRVETIIKLIKASWTMEEPEQSFQLLAEAEKAAQAQAGKDRRHLAHIHYWMGWLYFVRYALPQALESFQQVLVEAREAGDADLLALVSVQLARVLASQGQFGKIEALLTPVLPKLEQTANWTEWIFALGFLGIALAARGFYTAGVVAGKRALARAQITKSHDYLARSHFFLSIIYGMGGDIPRMLEESGLVEMARQSDDWVLLYLEYAMRGLAQSRMGQHKEALDSMTRSQTVSQQHGSRLLLMDWVAAASVEVLLAAGRVEEALAQAQVTVKLARSVEGLYGEGVAQRLWAQILVEVSPPRWDEAEAHLAASLYALETGEALVEAARTHMIWGHLCRKKGEMVSAVEHFTKAAAQFEQAGLVAERDQACGYLAP